MDTYRATNTTNGKFYIGSTTNFERRKKQHLRSKRNYPFQNALRNNPDAFEWEVWSDDSDEPVLEQALLDMWFGKECCYNLSPIAELPSGTTGRIWWKNELTQEQTLCFEKPEGEGWKPGMLQKTNKGKSWWVNKHGEEQMSDTCPGSGWEPGRSTTVSEKVSKTLAGKSTGEKHNMSKLTDIQRDDIVNRGVLGFGGNVKQLAIEFNMSGRQIRHIITRWKRQ